MTFFYNSRSGGYANESPPAPQYFDYEAQLRLGLGWHSYGSFAEMLAAIKQNNWPPPQPDSVGLRANAVSGTPGAVANNAVSDVIGNVNASNLIVRIGEILLGIVLIGVGIAKLTGTANIISTVAKVPLP
jgi:hypothetical protein